MGGSESSQGGRRVSFGLDEQGQVRVLQGIRLTDDVVSRMKESSPSKRDSQKYLRASDGTAPSSLVTEGKPKPTGTAGSPSPSLCLWCSCRYEKEQALVHEELLRLAKREREAASEARGRNDTKEERQKVAQM
ncbi:MIC25 protein, partial [Neodrepanis coruscans]|nr:MIC25 protein [Neodrepanis coruscans]